MSGTVYSCDIGFESLTTVDGVDVPGCETGHGQWIVAPEPWFSVEIPKDQVNDLLSQMVLVAAVMWVGKRVLKAIDR